MGFPQQGKRSEVGIRQLCLNSLQGPERLQIVLSKSIHNSASSLHFNPGAFQKVQDDRLARLEQRWDVFVTLRRQEEVC